MLSVNGFVENYLCVLLSSRCMHKIIMQLSDCGSLLLLDRSCCSFHVGSVTCQQPKQMLLDKKYRVKRYNNFYFLDGKRIPFPSFTYAWELTHWGIIIPRMSAVLGMPNLQCFLKQFYSEFYSGMFNRAYSQESVLGLHCWHCCSVLLIVPWWPP